MTFSFRPAERESLSLLIGISSPSGGGKTFSAMELATGMSGGKPFAVIDTENGRALHYADMFKFEHARFDEPYRPGRYAEAIRQADEASYPVIIVDQASHEHAGPGGILDWHDEEVSTKIKRAKDRGDNRPEWKLRDIYNPSGWIAPKSEHKRVFVTQILKTRAHLIFCFRAEQKIEIAKGADGKTKIEPKRFASAMPEFAQGVHGWSPICEKTLIFEMTLSLLMLAENPGVPIPIKLQQQHRGMVPLDKPINRHAGEALAAWAKGGTASGGLDEVLATIGKAQTPAELKALGPGIKKAGLNKRDTEKARKAYSERAAEIKKSKDTPDEVEGM